MLAPFLDIEHLHPSTRDGTDMSKFKFSAWTANPDAIPRSADLLLPEPGAVDDDADPDRAEGFVLHTLRKPVQIFVTLSEDFLLSAHAPAHGPTSPPDGSYDDGAAAHHPSPPKVASAPFVPKAPRVARPGEPAAGR